MTAFAYRSDISAPQMAAYTNTSTGKSPSPEHSRVSDMMTGDGVEMFTCSVLSAGSTLAEGAGTQMSTCSVLNIGTAAANGDATGLFTCSV